MNASITVVWSLFKSCALKLSRIEAHWPTFSSNIQIAGNRDTPGSLQIAELELSLKWKAGPFFNGNNGNYPDCVMSKDFIALHSKSRTVYSQNTGSASLSHLTREPRTAARKKRDERKTSAKGNNERERKPLATPLTFPSLLLSPIRSSFFFFRSSPLTDARALFFLALKAPNHTNVSLPKISAFSWTKSKEIMFSQSSVFILF